MSRLRVQVTSNPWDPGLVVEILDTQIDRVLAEVLDRDGERFVQTYSATPSNDNWVAFDEFVAALEQASRELNKSKASNG
jgi:hypothetical protein